MHAQLYGSGFHSRPGFMDAVTIAVIPEPLQKAAASNIMGMNPRTRNDKKNGSDSKLSSRRSRSSGIKRSSSKFTQSRKSGRTTYSSRGSKGDKSRQEQPHNDGGHDTAPVSQCPTETIFDCRHGSSINDNASKAGQLENNGIGSDLARAHKGHNHPVTDREYSEGCFSPSKTTHSQSRSDPAPEKHVPVPLDQSPHFTLMDLKYKQPQPRPSSPSFLNSVLKCLKLSPTHRQKMRRPPLDQDAISGHRYQTRSQVSYAPERDPMYKGIPRKPGQRFEGEVVVHRRWPHENREQGGNSSDSQPGSHEPQSHRSSRRDTNYASRSEPMPHERRGNGSGRSRQTRSHETLRQGSGQTRSCENLGRSSGGSSPSNENPSRESHERKSGSGSHSYSRQSRETLRQDGGGNSSSTKTRYRSRLRQGSLDSSPGSEPRHQELRDEGGQTVRSAQFKVDTTYADDNRLALFPTLSEMGMVRRVDGKGIPIRPVVPEDSISSIGRKRRQDRKEEKAARSKFAELLRQKDIEEEKMEAEE